MLTQFLASVNVKNGSDIWVGGRQMDFHNFNWADGSIFNYSFWEQGEPNFPPERCVEMSWRNGRWNDISCKLKRAVLCERQLTRPPAKPFHYQPSSECLLDSNCSITTISPILQTSISLNSEVVPRNEINQTTKAQGIQNNSTGTESEIKLKPGDQPNSTESFVSHTVPQPTEFSRVIDDLPLSGRIDQSVVVKNDINDVSSTPSQVSSSSSNSLNQEVTTESAPKLTPTSSNDTEVKVTTIASDQVTTNDTILDQNITTLSSSQMMNGTRPSQI